MLGLYSSGETWSTAAWVPYPLWGLMRLLMRRSAAACRAVSSCGGGLITWRFALGLQFGADAVGQAAYLALTWSGCRRSYWGAACRRLIISRACSRPGLRRTAVWSSSIASGTPGGLPEAIE